MKFLVLLLSLFVFNCSASPAVKSHDTNAKTALVIAAFRKASSASTLKRNSVSTDILKRKALNRQDDDDDSTFVDLFGDDSACKLYISAPNSAFKYSF